MVRYIRYEYQGKSAYGIWEQEIIRPLPGCPWQGEVSAAGEIEFSQVKLLYPCEPTKILAVGRNYKSHLDNRPAPEKPEIFFKPPTALLSPGGDIVIPGDAQDLHYEGELVIVMGKRAKNITAAAVPEHIWGYTCGNDISERKWQKGDIQWWRAKGSDTFAPLGPAIVTGLDYRKFHLQTRVNGEVKQSQSLSDLIFDIPTIVSFISKYVGLEPGDIIYTGTPGTTSALKPGDKVEVEIAEIGVLRNGVVAA